ncbi:polysaccharide lyase 8 family protein [Wenjunlia tyrosinilytica]|uniref:Lyase n=1 Tax=Wenjunlia tyrosinilytica TaxID=1544741 RepID=A0A918E1Y9_9ACTN|nr:polysaccharide lyase 8 family protein [Wenjunlia tyrosinilytica]GGO97666.1 lyase [Wenjunlia tyrosinilytica]
MVAAAGALALAALPGGRARAAGRASSAADVYSELLNRWTGVLVGTDAPLADADYTAAVRAQDRASGGWLATLRTGAGRTTPWDDLPLGSASANVTAVANRLRAIALSFATPASALHRNAEAAASLAAGVGLLHDAAYHAGQKEYGNWWDWEIGTSKALGDTCVLLGEALPADTLGEVMAAIDHFVPDPRRMLDDSLVSTGANRVDLCRAVAVRGALGRSPERLSLASSSLAGVLDPVLIGDGFHPDGSFVMHTWVAYPGTYGEVLVRGMAELMRLLAGTQWEVAANERQRIVSVVEETFVPFLNGGLVADCVRGRAISRTGERDADDGFLLAVDVLNLAGALRAGALRAGDGAVAGDGSAVAAGARSPLDAGARSPLDATTARRLRGLAKGWLRANTWRPLSTRQPVQIAVVVPVLADDSTPPVEAPPGHFPFPDMERFAHRRPGWAMTLALNSDRVARYEYMNEENARGWHTGDGMAQLHLDADPFHYTDGYWPTVDAKRLPGTTVDTTPLAPGQGGDNDHEPLTGTRWSGGVRLGSFGMASIGLTGIASPLTARKSWLFLDDAVVVAGSAITASGGRRVETVIENRRTEAAPTTHPGWAHLAGVGGYVLLRERPKRPERPSAGAARSLPERPSAGAARSLPELRSLSEVRTGAWRDLNKGGPTTPVTRPYTTLWLDHGADPSDASYACLQLPAASLSTTAARAEAPGVEVVALTPTVHAFRAAPGLTAAVFFAPGSAAGITVDAPCSVLVLEDGAEVRVAVSDPSRTSPLVTVTLAEPAHATLTASDDGVAVLSTSPARLLVETGARHGATLAATLRRGRSPHHGRLHRLTPVTDATVRDGEVDSTSPLLTVSATSTACLTFDLTRVHRPVRRARLWLYGRIPDDPATRADDMLQTLLRAHGPVAEDRATPGPGPALGQGWATTYPDWFSFDVTGAVRAAAATAVGRGCLKLAVTPAGAEGGEIHEARIHSRENPAHPPLLHLITD